VFQVVRGEGRGWTSGGRWRGRAAGALPQLQVADRGGGHGQRKKLMRIIFCNVNIF
jgi:hypothetical protein